MVVTGRPSAGGASQMSSGLRWSPPGKVPAVSGRRLGSGTASIRGMAPAEKRSDPLDPELVVENETRSMRQGQQKRMRGRNRGGKGPNPLSRSYESNGPDVKVRGTAAHIAEKYVQLARDAQSSGDPILAESYLQHAEHYFRIIAAAQPQFNGQQPYGGQLSDEDEEGDDADFDGPIPSMPQAANQAAGEGETQPRFQQPRDRNFNDRGGFSERSYDDRPFRDRGAYGERQDGDRQQGERYNRGERYQNDRGPRQDRHGDRQQDRGFDGPPNGFRDGESEGERGFNQRFGRRGHQDRRFGDRPYQDRQSDRQPYQDQRPYAAQPQAAPQPIVPVDEPQPEIADDATLSALARSRPPMSSGTPG